MSLNAISSFQIVTCHHLTDWKQVLFPKSRKRRVRKKWRKRESNWKFVDSRSYIVDTVHRIVYCSPTTRQRLEQGAAISAEKEARNG